MRTRQTRFPEVVVITPAKIEDSRGYFSETYNAKRMAETGIEAIFVQDNQSLSATAGTVRALHFQTPPESQAKLVRVLKGAIFDVAVDLRKGSPTYGQWVSERLTAEGGEQLFVPKGFAHGFCTLEPDTIVAYKVDSFYAPTCDRGLFWADETLAIDWPVARDQAALSAKDLTLPRFVDFDSPFTYGR